MEALLDSEPNRLGAAFRETLYRHTGGRAPFTVELLLLSAGHLPESSERPPLSGRLAGADAEAEACFQLALEVTRQQEASALRVRSPTCPGERTPHPSSDYSHLWDGSPTL